MAGLKKIYNPYDPKGPEVTRANIINEAIAPMGKFNGNENVARIAEAQVARQELSSETPVKLASQTFPQQDLTDARHAVPVQAQAEKPNSFMSGFNAARQSNQGYQDGGRYAQTLPPAASLGYGAGNVANVFLKPQEPPVFGGQRFPSDLNRAVSQAPRQPSELQDATGDTLGGFAQQPIYMPKNILPAASAATTQTTAPNVAQSSIANRDDALRGMPSTQPASPMLGELRQPNSPVVPTQVGAAGGTMGVNLSDNDRAIKESLAAIDNRVATSGIKVTPEQAEQIAALKQQAGFLRGGTDRVPVGPDGRPLRLGGASSPGGNYSFQGSPEAAQRFNSAVSPGEYSPEAQAARGKQQEQFLTRQGFEKVDPATGLTPSQMNGLNPAERLGFAKMKSDAQTAKDTNSVAMMNATGNAEQRNAQTKLTMNQVQKQEEIDRLSEEYDTATPERQKAIDKKFITLGVKQPNKPNVEFQPTYDEFGKQNGSNPFVYDAATGEAKPLRVGGQKKDMPTFKNRDEEKQYLINLAKTDPQEYARMKAAATAVK